MCKFAMMGPYKEHYACFDCRKMIRFRIEDISSGKERKYLCPDCQGQTQAMGYSFRPPRKENKKQWKRIEILALNGVVYGMGCCREPGYRPKYLREVPEFLGIPNTKKAKRLFIGKYKQIKQAAT